VWPASRHRTLLQAATLGAATGLALRRAGVHVDLAPVLDLAGGPLGSRHFRSPALALAFARGLAVGGAAACVKHFPGLGTAPVSTDERPHVDALVNAPELAAFRAAVRAGVPCVMVSNAFYRRFGQFRASVSPDAYRLLRSLGFRGVAITDSLSIVRRPPRRWARQAIRAGADLLLFTSPAHARRAIEDLVPLARRGELDAAVARVLRFRVAVRR
jgi:beta-N-acetylhexosaminidase